MRPFYWGQEINKDTWPALLRPRSQARASVPSPSGAGCPGRGPCSRAVWGRERAPGGGTSWPPCYFRPAAGSRSQCDFTDEGNHPADAIPDPHISLLLRALLRPTERMPAQESGFSRSPPLPSFLFLAKGEGVHGAPTSALGPLWLYCPVGWPDPEGPEWSFTQPSWFFPMRRTGLWGVENRVSQILRDSWATLVCRGSLRVKIKEAIKNET